MPISPSAMAADQALWAARQTVRPAMSPAAGGAAQAAGDASKVQATGENKKAKEAGQQFEALYLRQMMEEMMPKDSAALFGEGTAGSVWRSMLADSMATTLSKTGTIGIAQMIIKPEPNGSKGK